MIGERTRTFEERKANERSILNLDAHDCSFYEKSLLSEINAKIRIVTLNDASFL